MCVCGLYVHVCVQCIPTPFWPQTQCVSVWETVFNANLSSRDVCVCRKHVCSNYIYAWGNVLHQSDLMTARGSDHCVYSAKRSSFTTNVQKLSNKISLLHCVHRCSLSFSSLVCRWFKSSSISFCHDVHFPRADLARLSINVYEGEGRALTHGFLHERLQFQGRLTQYIPDRHCTFLHVYVSLFFFLLCFHLQMTRVGH